MGLAGGGVEPERVQRPSVVGELGLAAGTLYGAELAWQAALSRIGRTGGDGEPEAQARAGAFEVAVGLRRRFRRVDRYPRTGHQDGADTAELAGRDDAFRGRAVPAARAGSRGRGAAA